jgi:hypothetical protein
VEALLAVGRLTTAIANNDRAGARAALSAISDAVGEG